MPAWRMQPCCRRHPPLAQHCWCQWVGMLPSWRGPWCLCWSGCQYGLLRWFAATAYTAAAAAAAKGTQQLGQGCLQASCEAGVHAAMTGHKGYRSVCPPLLQHSCLSVSAMSCRAMPENGLYLMPGRHAAVALTRAWMTHSSTWQVRHMVMQARHMVMQAHAQRQRVSFDSCCIERARQRPHAITCNCKGENGVKACERHCGIQDDSSCTKPIFSKAFEAPALQLIMVKVVLASMPLVQQCCCQIPPAVKGSPRGPGAASNDCCSPSPR